MEMAQGGVARIIDRCLDGEMVGRAELITLLSVDAESDAVQPIYEAGREAARRFVNNEARLWASLGLNFAPCPMSCSFCAFGEKWGVVKTAGEMPHEQALAWAVKFAQAGMKWLSLRTTEDYPLDKLCELAHRIGEATENGIELVANTGEFDAEGSRRLREAGFTTIYHVMRMREGIDTGIPPEDRRKTLAAIRDSDLKLAFLIDPIGPEHNAEELADTFLCALEYGATLSGAMARVPIPGTPLAHYGQIGDRKLALITAVTRLVGGPRVPDICVHPHSELAVRAGANTVVVETGAVPRDTEEIDVEWQGFTCEKAWSLMAAAGYQTKTKGGVS
jgi:biotin synthase